MGSDDIDRRMMLRPVSYKRHRFPPEIIARAVWLYLRFPLTLRLLEEMLLERGIVVSYETIRRCAIKFGHRHVNFPWVQRGRRGQFFRRRL